VEYEGTNREVEQEQQDTAWAQNLKDIIGGLESQKKRPKAC